MDKTISPCNGECRIDKNSRVCAECFRSLDEIVEWSNLSATDKIFVNEAVQKRKEVAKLYEGKQLPDLSYIS